MTCTLPGHGKAWQLRAREMEQNFKLKHDSLYRYLLTTVRSVTLIKKKTGQWDEVTK
jgi:hypothetical protein